jgi:hypothetical protein
MSMSNSSEYVRAWRKRTKLWLIDLHGGCCVICQYKRCSRALEFHHLDASTKLFSISKNTRVANQKLLWEESKKCILVCGNCHAEIEDELIDVSRMRSSARLERFSDKEKVGGSNPPASICKCGKSISKGKVYCRGCAQIHRRLVQWPSRQEVLKLVASQGYAATGRQIGVSDNGIRKFLDRTSTGEDAS